MLTRFKQLYNGLTYSHAYDLKTGKYDDSKINTKSFTPHNLRAIFIGYNGAILVHYVSYTNKPLVDFIEFKGPVEGLNASIQDIQKQENWYESNLKEKKSLIDTLWFSQGLKFNYVEEIYLFIDGFDELEKEKEIRGKDAFLSNPKIRASLKRLERVAVVSGLFLSHSMVEELRQYYKTPRFNENLVTMFKNTPNLKIDPIEFNYQRTELGLHIQPGLLESKYDMDAAYSPELNKNGSKEGDKEKYKLSRYFYLEEQFTKKKIKEEKEAEEKKKLEDEQKKKDEELKKAEEIKKKQEEQKKLEEPKDDESYDYQLEAAVDATIEKLSKYYAPLWNHNYIGILHKDGIYTTPSHNNSSIKKKKAILKAIYDSWSEIAFDRDENGSKKDAKDIENNKIVYGMSYLPGFHIENLKNKQEWRKSAALIKKDLLRKYNTYFEKQPEKINELERGITNCIIIEKYNKNLMIIRLTGISKSKYAEFKQIFNTRVGATFVGRTNDGLIADASYEDEILTLTYIFNYTEFKNEILFAYKQYQDGFKPSLQNAMVGLRMNGRPMTVDLKDNTKFIYSVIAGSRSGKGTMTMGLLANIFGVGGSVIYLDNKPDIGAMLWDLEREYAHQGLKVLAIDMGTEKEKFMGIEPIRTGPMNLIKEDKPYEAYFRTLRLVKLFQLFSFISKHYDEVERETGISTSNLYFVIDELKATNGPLTNLGLTVKQAMKDTKPGKKATEEEKVLHEHYKRLNQIINKELGENLTSGTTKDFGQSGVKIILIGQHMNAEWKIPDVNFVKSFVGKLISSTQMTFSGREQAVEKTFNFDKSQADLAKQTGVFNLTKSKPVPVEDVLDYKMDAASKFDQFRSYFSIIHNDFNYDEFIAEGKEAYLTNHERRYTSQFLNNYKDKSDSIFESVLNEICDMDTGKNREEITFSGLIKVMQQGIGMDDATLVANMGKGYNLMDAVFRQMKLGDYSCIEEYLCDCSPNSIYTQLELEQRFNGDYSSTEKIEYVEEDEDSFDPRTAIDVDYKEVDDDVVLEDFTDNTSTQPTPKVTPTNSQGPQGLPRRPQRPQPTPQPINQSTQQSPQSNQAFNNSAQRQGKIVHPTQIPYADDDPLYTQKVNKAQNERMNAANGHTVYNRPLHIEENPFQYFNENSTISTLCAIKDMSKILEQDIETNICPKNMITSFAIQNGMIYINGVAYLPTFEDNLIRSLPISVRDKVAEGQLAEFFNLHTVRKYKNLEQLMILDGNLAQGRARKEMGIGFKQKWSWLFKKYDNLQYIQVGNIYYHRDNPDTKDEEPILEKFKINPKLTFGTGNRRTIMDKVWDSTPVRVLAKSVGWTGAAVGVWAAATFLGPIGMVFSAFAIANTFKVVRDDIKPNKQVTNNTTSSTAKSTNSSKKTTKSSNKKNNNGFSQEYD